MKHLIMTIILTAAVVMGIAVPASAAQAGSVPRCRVGHLSVSMAPDGAAAGTAYYQLRFTNTSATYACSLTGWPGVSFVTAPAGMQVGAPATRSTTYPVRTVVVRPGKTAVAELGVADWRNYPRRVCDPVKVPGLRVYAPGAYWGKFVPFATRTCFRPVPVLSVTTVRGGHWAARVAALMTGLHGYTVADIDRLARLAVWRHGQSVAPRRQALQEAAWDGITEHLCTATEPPSRRALMWAARAAMSREIRDYQHHHGTRTDSGHNGSGFQRYWRWYEAMRPAHEVTVTDAVAVTQVLKKITLRQRNAITALAVTEDYDAAAVMLGMSPPAFRMLLGQARRACLELWHEGETPSRLWRRDRRVGRREPSGLSVPAGEEHVA